MSKDLSLDIARAAIAEVVDAFKEEENDRKMAEAKEKANDDTMKFMQFVFPIALNIQIEVIQKYGFHGDQDGIIAFTNAVRSHAQDPEVHKLASELKAMLMPPGVMLSPA